MLDFGLSFEEYVKLRRLNWHSLQHIGKSPRHFLHHQQVPVEDTTALRLGRVTHTAILEPSAYAQRVAVWQGGRRAGGPWESFRDAATAKGQDVLTVDENAACLAMQAAVRGDACAAKYLDGGHPEVTALWRHRRESIDGEVRTRDCKGRVDYLHPELGIVDLKTCRDGGPDIFFGEAWRRGYIAQAAFYVDGLRAADKRWAKRPLAYTIIAVEKAPPYAVAVYAVGEEALEAGRQHYLNLLDRLHVCERDAAWPSYSGTEIDYQLPRWVVGRDFDDEGDVVEELDLAIGQD